MSSDTGVRVDDEEKRFTAMYDACRMRVWAYAASRVGSQLADEVVSETFTVAWRRFSEMPASTLPWLLGVARNVIRDSARADRRRDSLQAELHTWAREPVGDIASGVADRIAMRQALAELSDADREVLILVAWQALSPREAARVIGCTAAAFRVRLHRARKRLAVALQAQSAQIELFRMDAIEMEAS
jgi:RNA polymerase sigma-70 factor (ECF subfamily)